MVIITMSITHAWNVHWTHKHTHTHWHTNIYTAGEWVFGVYDQKETGCLTIHYLIRGCCGRCFVAPRAHLFHSPVLLLCVCFFLFTLSFRLSTHSPKLLILIHQTGSFPRHFEHFSWLWEIRLMVCLFFIVGLALYSVRFSLVWPSKNTRNSLASKTCFHVREFHVAVCFRNETEKKLIRIDTDAGKFVNFSSDEWKHDWHSTFSELTATHNYTHGIVAGARQRCTSNNGRAKQKHGKNK